MVSFPITGLDNNIALQLQNKQLHTDVMTHGSGLLDAWTSLSFRKEPDDIVGKIVWWAGLFSQLIISSFTFPAAIAAFLMEESAQSQGMGAYLLYISKDWGTYIPYIKRYMTSLETFISIVKGLAAVNPTAGGACLIYLDSARVSASGMFQAALIQLQREAKSLGITMTEDSDPIDIIAQIEIAHAEKAAQAIQDAQTYGTLRIASTPSNALIYLDGTATGLETPETFKKLVEGPHEVSVAKYNTKTGKTDVFSATIQVKAGQKREVTLHITTGVVDDITNPGDVDEEETPQLPDFIKTTVTCAKMIDGDTFETTTGERIRILGMDAPETGQPIADQAKTFMEGKLVDHKVDIKIQTHVPIDAYGRTLAIVTYRDENVAVSSIANGLAKAFIGNDARYDPTRYLEAEKLAKERKLGIWDPATPPIVWRP